MPGITYNNLSTQTVVGPIFNDALESPKSVSVGLTNDAATNYEEIPSGTIVAKCWDGYHRPTAYDKANGAVAAAAVITVAESENAGDTSSFNIGDWVFIGAQALPFKVQAVDSVAKTITMAENVTLSDGDTLVVDPSRSVSTLQAAAGVNIFPFVTADEYKKFRVGDVVTLDGVAGARNVTSIDSGGNTITVDGAVGTVLAGAKIVSQARGGYKIGVETVYITYGAGVAPSNVVMATRIRGECFSKRTRGLFPSAKAALNLVEFNTLRV